MEYNTMITAGMGLFIIGGSTFYIINTNKLKKKISKLERMLQAHLLEKGE